MNLHFVINNNGDSLGIRETKLLPRIGEMVCLDDKVLLVKNICHWVDNGAVVVYVDHLKKNLK